MTNFPEVHKKSASSIFGDLKKEMTNSGWFLGGAFIRWSLSTFILEFNEADKITSITAAKN